MRKEEECQDLFGKSVTGVMWGMWDVTIKHCCEVKDGRVE